MGTDKTTQTLEAGYAFVAKGDLSTIQNDDWEIRVLDPVTAGFADAYEVGRATIDGTLCRVWWSRLLEAYIAQTFRGPR